MAEKIIKTARLVLRPWVMADAARCAELLGDFQVTRWLSELPHPYVLDNAVSYIRDGDPANRYCIEFEGNVAGGISTKGGFGFWLGRPLWGQGMMGEAAHAVVNSWFEDGNDILTSGYFVGNQASQAIHQRLGFVKGAIVQNYSLAQGRKVALQKVSLCRADWLANHG